MSPFGRPQLTRRSFLARVGMGMGAISFGALAQGQGQISSPLAPHAPHFAPRAKRVIHLFLNGGPSHVDTFDPKPMLAKYAGQPIPGENLRTKRKTGAAFPSPFKFTKCGQSGLEISELFARTAAHADDIAGGVAPVAVGYILKYSGHNWRITFWISAVIYVIGGLCWRWIDPVTPLESADHEATPIPATANATR